MSIEKVYDTVAKHYNQDLSETVLRSANVTAQNLITKHTTPDDIQSLLALGIGDGIHIKPYKELFPKAHVGGIDISSNMLKKAQSVLACETYHGDISDAVQLTKGQQFNLTIAHFVCAYVEPNIILSQAKSLTMNDGYVSLVTNTFNSFPKIMAAYQKYATSKSLIATQLRKHIDATFETVFVPQDMNDLKQKFASHQLKIIDEKEMTIEVDFEDSSALYDFFMQGGWFASGLVHPLISANFVRFSFKKLVEKHLNFPFRDTMNIAVVLGQK